MPRTDAGPRHGDEAPPVTRSFLFLQGPQSLFFERLGRALIARGHRVHRINLNLGDRLFWRLPASDFRGRFEDWRAFAAAAMQRHAVTDLVLLGQHRPYHVAAAEAARARGVTVFTTDLGYVRPGWLTLEVLGAANRSTFPRDPAAIRALAETFAEPDLAPRFATSFPRLAAHDVAYNAAAVLGGPLYPHYRRHGVYHPFAEYAAWLANAPRRLAAKRATAAAKAALAAAPGSYFLFALQLATDFQLRAESPFADPREPLRQVLHSFAASGTGRRLVVVAHPLDEGLIDWRRIVRDAGLGERAVFLEGGIPDPLLTGAAGVVTVNSTVGIAALRRGVPTKPLGNAVYDIAGLTHPGELDEFWRAPPRPDPALVAAFVRVLVGVTQVRGGYLGRAAQAAALAGFVERLERGPDAAPAGAVTQASGEAQIPSFAARPGFALSRGGRSNMIG